ncbi:hypothetical protein NW759_015577 [Fusarium solani]|nr:hypothetical protein NW759_015577 [Fusarium solani]
MICQTCRDILEVPVFPPSRTCTSIPNPEHPHHATLQSLRGSVESKCWVCCTFWFSFMAEERTAISQAVGHLATESGSGQLGFTSLSGCFHQDMNFFLGFSSNAPGAVKRLQEYGRPFHVFEIKDDEELLDLDPLRSLQVPSNMQCPETFSLAKGWIDDCGKSP